MQGDPNRLQLPQGNFEAAPLFAARFSLLVSVLIGNSIFCQNNRKVPLQTLMQPCHRGIWLIDSTGASQSAGPMHPTFTDNLDLWTSARTLPSRLLPKLSDSTRIMQEVCGKGESPEHFSFPPLLS